MPPPGGAAAEAAAVDRRVQTLAELPPARLHALAEALGDDFMAAAAAVTGSAGGGGGSAEAAVSAPAQRQRRGSFSRADVVRIANRGRRGSSDDGSSIDRG